MILVVCELSAFLATVVLFGKPASAQSLFDSFLVERVAPGKVEGEDCTWGDSIVPHPYLAFRYRRSGRCKVAPLNEHGLLGELPMRRLNDRYSVLLLGGSTAEDLYIAGNLEHLLNRDYVSPNGGSFAVLNGSISGGKQPMQAISFLLLHDRVDAVVSLEGWNEFREGGWMDAQSKGRFEEPVSVWSDIMAATSGSYEDLLKLRAAHGVYRNLRDHPLSSRSHMFFLIGYSVIAVAQRGHESSKRRGDLHGLSDLPPDLSKVQKRAYFIEQYGKYLASIQAVATRKGLKTAFFFQPVAMLRKPLTSAESQRVVLWRSAGRSYEEMVTALLELRRGDTPVFSLLEVFTNSEEELYLDECHLLPNTRGNEILATEMLRNLESAWQLRRRD